MERPFFNTKVALEKALKGLSTEKEPYDPFSFVIIPKRRPGNLPMFLKKPFKRETCLGAYL